MEKDSNHDIPTGYLCQAELVRSITSKKAWTYHSILLATRASKRLSSELFQRTSGLRVSLIPPRILNVPRKARNVSEYKIADRSDPISIYPKVNVISIIILQRKFCLTGRRCKKNWVWRYFIRTAQVNPSAPYTGPLGM